MRTSERMKSGVMVMSLRDRLRMHFQAQKKPTPASESPAGGAETPLPGFICREKEKGAYLYRRKVYPLEKRMGLYSLGELRGSPLGASPLWPEGVEERAVEDLLFFDTETTGLGTGAGNLIFLYGIGYYREDSFIVEHFFLPRVEGEPALLEDFLELVSSFPVVVSYNGKAFDWNQLKTRTTVHRLPWVEEKVHCDLLYPSRRLWREQLPSCRLQEVEAARLGVKRLNDVPGQLAPTLYFDYLKGGDPAKMDGVFRHNEQDVLSLVSLWIHLNYLSIGKIQPTHPAESLALGNWWRERDPERALARFSQIHTRPDLPLRYRREAFRGASSLLKGKGEWEAALQLWMTWMEEDRLNPEPCVELSKLFEHRTGEVNRAYRMAQEAKGRLLKRKRRGQGNCGRELDALNHRLRRLEEKRIHCLF
ncbi:ribonuclease H-like domain-containing protein [Kroppenstedtia guangzhouensis]|nr:ribonuclease H-like domain-containing protein [Kroppenstedtia guangzhouensis]